jgi:YYY domain-containing protein
MTAILFLALVAAAGLMGYALLIRLGMEDFDAWAGGRIAGLVLAAFPAWWAGTAGFRAWRAIGFGVLVLGAAWGLGVLWQRRRAWREILAAEAVTIGAALLILFVRLDHPQIAGQEKPMDVGIFSTLLRAEGFPPPDMWLAGETLPYYYWGALLWTVPISLSGLPMEFAYNLIVALIGAMVAAGMWALGRRLSGGGHLAGLVAAFFGVFAGTPDGLRQLLAGVGVRHVNIWTSSRQDPDVITEFPLFTAWLGDLHPHLLSMPIACVAILLAWYLGKNGPRLLPVAVLAVLFGIAWAANPWCMPPTLAAAALMMLTGDGRFHWPRGEGLQRWFAVGLVAVGGWLAGAPFHLGFHPPFQGIKAVFAWTSPANLMLYGGSLLLPAFAAAIILLHRRFGGTVERVRALTLTTIATVLVLAVATGRPSMLILAGCLAILVLSVLGKGERPDRPALALAALGVFLFLVPELVYVVDSYGERLHRMNTVFKSYIQAWLFLAAALPALVQSSIRRTSLRVVVMAILIVPTLPHLAWMVMNQFSGRPLGLDGIAWMTPGDRAIVHALRKEPPGSFVVEAVGGAYTEYARLSANSGVPAYIGWENHELVWRGHGVVDETNRRRALVEELYRCADPDRVREIAAEMGVDLVAVGSLERSDFSDEGLSAVAAAGSPVIELEDGILVRIATPVHGESPSRGDE